MAVTSVKLVDGETFGTQSEGKISLKAIETLEFGDLGDDLVLGIADDAFSAREGC